MIKEFFAGLLASLTGVIGAQAPVPDQSQNIVDLPPEEIMQELGHEEQNRFFHFLDSSLQKRRGHRGPQFQEDHFELPENWDQMSREERKAWMQEQRAERFEEQFGVARPDGWEDMTKEERRTWMEENIDPDLLPHKPELPENWDQMSREERKAWMHEQHAERFEETWGVALPDDWEEYSKEERKTWLEENVPDFEPPKPPHRRGQRGFGPGQGPQGLGQ